MSSLLPPPGWKDVHAKEFRRSFGRELEYHRVSKPYRPLLSWNEESCIYLIRCGKPESDNNPQSCYVLFNQLSSDVVKITFPDRLEDIYNALEYFQTGYHEEIHYKTELVEMLNTNELPVEYQEGPEQQAFIDEYNQHVPKKAIEDLPK